MSPGQLGVNLGGFWSPKSARAARAARARAVGFLDTLESSCIHLASTRHFFLHRSHLDLVEFISFYFVYFVWSPMLLRFSGLGSEAEEGSD